MTEVNIKVRAI